MFRHLPLVCLLVCAIVVLPAQDEIEKLLTEYAATVEAANAVYTKAVDAAEIERQKARDKADAKIVDDLERLGKKAARSGDSATVARVWKEILRIDREHSDARAFFEAIGQLDAVLAEVTPSQTDLLGNPIGSQTPLTLALVSVAPRMLFSSNDLSIQPLVKGTRISPHGTAAIGFVSSSLDGAKFLSMDFSSPSDIVLDVRRPGTVAVVLPEGSPLTELFARYGFKADPSLIVEVGGAKTAVLRCDVDRPMRVCDISRPAGAPALVIVAEAIIRQPPRRPRSGQDARINRETRR